MPTTTTKKANLGTAWMTDNDIRHTLTKIQHNRQVHDSLVRSARMKIEQRRNQLESSLSDFSERERTPMVNKATAGYRGELARHSKDSRIALTRELAELAQRVRSAATHYVSPMQMLMRDTLGSERRSRLMQQLEYSGPVELASLAELAAATKDKELAAALCSRVYGMKRDSRPFHASELANVLFGEQHRELSQALIEAERRVLEALQADQEFETGKGSPHRAIEIAMLKKREQEVGAYVMDESDDDAGPDDAEPDRTAGNDRIEAGLRARRNPATITNESADTPAN